MNELLKLIAIRLRMQRQVQDMRIKEVAEKLDVTPSYISAIETGKSRLSLEIYLGLCSIYGIQPGKFLDAVIAEHQTGKPHIEVTIFAKLVSPN